MNQPEKEQVEVPEEALKVTEPVEAAWGIYLPEERGRREGRQQERERVKEALLSDEVIAAANAESRERHNFHPYPHITHTLLQAAFDAAVTTLRRWRKEGHA